MTTPTATPCPMPASVRNTLLAALDIAEEECGQSQAIKEAREWLKKVPVSSTNGQPEL